MKKNDKPTVFLRWDSKRDQWLPSWRGRIEQGGRTKEVKLGVRWDGRPPAKGGRHGDRVFEDTRRRAQNELDAILDGSSDRREALRVAEQIQRLKYGNDSSTADTPVEKSALFEAWRNAPHAKERGAMWERVAASSIGTFIDWVNSHSKGEKTAGAVSAATISGYFQAREAEGRSGRTRNIERGILEVVFRTLAPYGDAIKTLSGMPKASERTIHRKALSPDELARLFAAAREAGGEWFGDLVVVAGCTALRRGDAARLRWENVDLEAGWVEVRPSKTHGEVAVEIPMLEPLREVLERRSKDAQPNGFVIPEAAEMARKNPQGLNWRLGKAIALAGLGGCDALPTATDIPDGVKRARRPSVLGWHSLRTSWATAAAAAGMPLETICEVTGHATTKTLREHYVQLDKARKRADVQRRLPAGFLGGKKGGMSDWDSVRELADGLTSKNAARTRRLLLDIASRNLPATNERHELAPDAGDDSSEY